MEGVVRTRVGYAGGTKENPTYYNLGNHAEAIQVDYDPTVITYRDLLKVFLASHNPTARSYSSQYRSIVFTHSEEQEEAVREAFRESEKRGGGKIRTEIKSFAGFTLAEDYHQKYGLRNNRSILEEFEVFYPDTMDIVNSTAAARVNGYLYGNGQLARLREELLELGLTEKSAQALESYVGRYSKSEYPK